jgi:hypothetical protein
MCFGFFAFRGAMVVDILTIPWLKSLVAWELSKRGSAEFREIYRQVTMPKVSLIDDVDAPSRKWESVVDGGGVELRLNWPARKMRLPKQG